MTNFSHLSVCVYARRTYLWKSALKISVASREIAEGDYIVNNTFMYKVSLLLQSEFESP